MQIDTQCSPVYFAAMMKYLFMILLVVCALSHPAWGVNSESNFGGVGVDGVALSDGTIAVRQLVRGGPAHLAGILPGDIITHIDGKATRGSNFKEMVNTRLRGKTGTKVSLKVTRGGKPLSFTLTRRQLVLPKR